MTLPQLSATTLLITQLGPPFDFFTLPGFRRLKSLRDHNAADLDSLRMIIHPLLWLSYRFAKLPSVYQSLSRF